MIASSLRVATIVRSSIVLVMGLASAQVRAIDFTAYFPLAVGARWIYQCTDSRGARADTPVVIARADARETLFLQNDLRCASDRSYLIVTDAAQYGLAKAVNDVGTIVFTPPARYLPRDASPGTSSTVSGTLTLEGDDAASGTYDESITVDGFEPVETPAGTFSDTVKVSRSLTMSFMAMGQLVQQKRTYVSWYAKNVGEVRYDTTSTSDDRPYSLHLVLKCVSSLGPCPTP